MTDIYIHFVCARDYAAHADARADTGRVSGTSIVNPDFAALARAYGGHGETVLHTGEFQSAWERAVGSGLPAIIEIALDPEALTAGGMTLTKMRENAEARIEKEREHIKCR